MTLDEAIQNSHVTHNNGEALGLIYLQACGEKWMKVTGAEDISRRWKRGRCNSFILLQTPITALMAWIRADSAFGLWVDKEVKRLAQVVWRAHEEKCAGNIQPGGAEVWLGLWENGRDY